MPTNSKKYYEENKYKYFVGPKARRKSKMRMRARRIMEKAGKVRKGDGKEVDHKDSNPNNNSVGNLRVISRYKNRRLGAKKRNGK